MAANAKIANSRRSPCGTPACRCKKFTFTRPALRSGRRIVCRSKPANAAAEPSSDECDPPTLGCFGCTRHRGALVHGSIVHLHGAEQGIGASGVPQADAAIWGVRQSRGAELHCFDTAMV